MEEIPRGHMPLLSSHPITHENTSPTHGPQDNCVFKDVATYPMECPLEGKILKLSLKWKHRKRTSPLCSHQWHLFCFSWASVRKDDSTKMPILTFLGPPCSL